MYDHPQQQYDKFMKFLADEMLGKLARWLRMAGFDVAWQRSIADSELLHQAKQENRFLLTRDTRLVCKLLSETYLFIHHDHLADQFNEFFQYFSNLKDKQHPLSRCVECNILLVSIEKAAVKEIVWPYVFQTQENFTTCPNCGRIFWEATHVAHIREKLHELIKS